MGLGHSLTLHRLRSMKALPRVSQASGAGRRLSISLFPLGCKQAVVTALLNIGHDISFNTPCHATTITAYAEPRQ
jgi:hypothetical protein